MKRKSRNDQSDHSKNLQRPTMPLRYQMEIGNSDFLWMELNNWRKPENEDERSPYEDEFRNQENLPIMYV